MNQNVLLTLFPVSSEAYQAFNELKVYRQTAESIIAQAVLIKKQNGVITMVDAFDASEKINSGMLTGGLIGGLLGIIGGPLGMLLVGSLGALIGGNVKAAESIGEGTLLATVTERLVDGDVAIIALVQERGEDVLNDFFNQFSDTTVSRWDAVVVQKEVQEALEVQKDLAIKARADLKAKKAEERQDNWDEFKDNLKAKFDELGDKIKKGLE